MNIKVSIVDDHPLILQGLQQALSSCPTISLVGSFSNGDELMKGISFIQPDVLLLDIMMPGKKGDELVPAIQRKYPSIKILVNTSIDASLTANNMLKLGVHGFLLKNAANATIIKAIETVHKGDVFMDASLKEKIRTLDNKVRKSVFSRATLTKRELEVLQLIVNGDSNNEIAKKLFLSSSTVENYRSNILLKLDAKNTAALVNKALKSGLAE